MPFYPENEIVLKPNEQKLVKVKAPFADEIFWDGNNKDPRW